LASEAIFPNQWISVKEDLPKDGRRENGQVFCIVCDENSIVREARYDDRKEIFTYGEYDECIEAVHWMPLPKPPNTHH